MDDDAPDEEPGEDADRERWEARVALFAGMIRGCAEVFPSPHDDWAGGMAWVVAQTDHVTEEWSWDEVVGDFTHRVEEAVSEQHLRLDRIDYVDWLLDAEPSGELLALAAEAADSGEPAFGPLDTHDEEQPVDAHEAETEAFEEVRAAGRLVFARLFGSRVAGYLLDFSDELVLLHRVDIDRVGLDGHVAIARSTVPLVALSQPRSDPGRIFVGAVAAVMDHFVMLHGVSVDAEWTGHHRYEDADIRAVEFGGGYPEALARVAGL